jgi:hypothetical protein
VLSAVLAANFGQLCRQIDESDDNRPGSLKLPQQQRRAAPEPGGMPQHAFQPALGADPNALFFLAYVVYWCYALAMIL